MDSITKLPESTALGYPGILLIIECLTKMTIYLPSRQAIDSPELAPMLLKHVLCKRGVLHNITTDCGKEFASRFWD
jgi:hypothetical protein